MGPCLCTQQLNRALNSKCSHFLHFFLWEALPSYNLCHSDLLRMERSRITPSHPSHHMIQACHSFMVSVSMSAEEKDRGRQTSSCCTITAQEKAEASLPPELWQTGIYTENELWVCNYTWDRHGTARHGWMTALKNTSVGETEDRWPVL